MLHIIFIIICDYDDYGLYICHICISSALSYSFHWEKLEIHIIYESLFSNLYKLHSLVFTVFTVFGSAGGGAVL